MEPGGLGVGSGRLARCWVSEASGAHTLVCVFVVSFLLCPGHMVCVVGGLVGLLFEIWIVDASIDNRVPMVG